MAFQLEFFDQNLKVLRNRALQFHKFITSPPSLSLSVHPPTKQEQLFILSFFFINEIIKRHKSLIGFFSLFCQSRYLREHGRGRTRKQSNNYFQQQPKSHKKMEISLLLNTQRQGQLRYRVINTSATPRSERKKKTKKRKGDLFCATHTRLLQSTFFRRACLFIFVCVCYIFQGLDSLKSCFEGPIPISA